MVFKHTINVQVTFTDRQSEDLRPERFAQIRREVQSEITALFQDYWPACSNVTVGTSASPEQTWEDPLGLIGNDKLRAYHAKAKDKGLGDTYENGRKVSRAKLRNMLRQTAGVHVQSASQMTNAGWEKVMKALNGLPDA